MIENPADGVMVSLIGGDLIETSQFNAKITLRFPRVQEIRFDKVRLLRRFMPLNVLLPALLVSRHPPPAAGGVHDH